MKKRKLTALILCIALVAVIFSGCSSKKEDAGAQGSDGQSGAPAQTQEDSQDAKTDSEDANTDSEASFKVGFLDQSGEAPPVVRMREIIRGVVEAAGGELVCDTSGEESADAQVSACEKLISAGCQGIIITPLADSVLPTIIKMCEENQVYLGITFRNIGDPSVAEVVEASEYYAGNCYEDEEEVAYNVMKRAMEKKDDIKEVALIALAVGDNTSDARVAGIKKACDEKGAKIVAEVRDINQASDATEAVQNFVAAYPNLDCVAVASCYDQGAITALPEAVKSTGKTPDDLCLVSCDGGSDMTKLFDYGYALSVGGGHLEIDRGSTAVMVVNAIKGNPLGKPAHISIPYMYFGSVEDVADYAVYVEGDVPIWTADEIKENLLISENGELDAEKVISYIQSYSLDDLRTRHENLVK
ncbi:MAG: sugar ABC transporter substrate-binding protein [Eubacterium sp.]|nr:sugar ABC transporter substrate-binding protein [Eubacterium sp.]